MKQKISYGLIIMLIIGIPLTLYFIYRDFPKVVEKIETATLVETKYDTVKTIVDISIPHEDVDFRIIERNAGGYPKLKIFTCTISDVRNLEGVMLSELHGKQRRDFLNIQEYDEVEITDIDWVYKPDYPIIYKVEVTFPNAEVILNLKIGTTAKPRFDIRLGDRFSMNNKFYPLFDIRGEYTAIDAVVFEEQALKPKSK